jgi:hypothetical protein
MDSNESAAAIVRHLTMHLPCGLARLAENHITLAAHLLRYNLWFRSIFDSKWESASCAIQGRGHVAKAIGKDSSKLGLPTLKCIYLLSQDSSPMNLDSCQFLAHRFDSSFCLQCQVIACVLVEASWATWFLTMNCALKSCKCWRNSKFVPLFWSRRQQQLRWADANLEILLGLLACEF